MGRQAIKEVHTADLKTEQAEPIVGDLKDRAHDIVLADASVIDKDYQAELAFMEERVMILINPSNEKNAPQHYPAWNNGKGAEVWDERTNSWLEMTYLPVGVRLTTKRKYLASLATAKADNITTRHDDVGAEVVTNRVNRQTSSVANVTVMGDTAKGNAWLAEIQRRNF